MHVLVTEQERIDTQALKRLEEKGFALDFSSPSTLLRDTEKLHTASVLLIASYTKITETVLARSPNLKALITCTAGTDHIDLDACRKRGITVYHAPATNANAVAEHALSLMFAVLRKIAHADSHVREGKWERHHFVAYELKGKTVGIIGFGAIGKLVAQKLSGCAVTMLVYDPLLTKEQVEQALGGIVRKVESLEEVLRGADVITLHVPLLPETKNLISRERIRLLKKNCILINTSRGGVVDETALVAALKAGKLFGAGLDVFAEEPLINQELKNLRNVVLTPHIAAHTVEARQQSSMLAVESFLKDFSAQ